MKVLSLIQPWATLIALGEKKIETRSWNTKYRGPLLIHASKKIDKIMYKEPFWSVLENQLIESSELPTGMIIAKCNLVDCFPIMQESKGFSAVIQRIGFIEENEYHFGDYTPGRFAWIFKNVEILKEPIPAKGQLGLWNFDFGEVEG
jgi:activating signal cointegrator 1